MTRRKNRKISRRKKKHERMKSKCYGEGIEEENAKILLSDWVLCKIHNLFNNYSYFN